MAVGGTGGIRTHGGVPPTPVFLATSVFTARRVVCSWSGLCLHHKPFLADRWEPSSLYTFQTLMVWLGSALPRFRRGFTDFDSLHSTSFPADARTAQDWSLKPLGHRSVGIRLEHQPHPFKPSSLPIIQIASLSAHNNHLANPWATIHTTTVVVIFSDAVVNFVV